MGLVAEVVLDGSAIGINVSIATVAVLAAAWIVRRRGRALDPVDAWLPATAIVLSLLVAIRADPFVAFLDLAGAAAFTGASVAAISGLAVTRRSIGIVIAIGAWVVESTLAGTARLLVVARPARRDAPRERPTWLGGVVRGLVLAVPLVVILATLFASADPIFRRTLDEAFGVRIDLGDLPGRAVFVLAVAWLVGGLLAVAASGIPAIERASLGAAAGSRPLALGRALGTVEALVVLLAVDLVVGLFVGLQVAYLFGGLDTLAAAGLTLQRLRPARLLRARRGGGDRRRDHRRPRDPGDGSIPRLPAPRPGPRRVDDRRARLGGAAPPAVPGRLRLDGAAPVRRGLDRRFGRRRSSPWPPSWRPIGRAGSGTRWRSSGSCRSSG